MIQTKDGIVLLDEKALTTLVKGIEANFTGWSYSISQTKEGTKIWMSPDKYHAMLDTDRAFGTTKVGDTGLFTNIPLHADEAVVQTTLECIKEVVGEHRSSTERDKLTAPNMVSLPRRQDRDARHAFRKTYKWFLRAVPDFESNGVILREVYVGSCQLSVDVSLRGKVAHSGEPFDISYDFQDDACLYESLEYAMKDIRELAGMKG